MAFEVPIAADFNPDQFDKVPEGRYHVTLDRAEEDGGKNGEMVCMFEIMAANDAVQVAKKIRVQFPKKPNMLWKIHRLALSLGMVTNDELKRLKAEGRSPSYDFPAAVGKHLHLELSPQKNDPKYMEQSFYRIDDPFCAAWPKNRPWLQRDGVKVPDAPESANGKKAEKVETKPVSLAGMV